MSHFYFRYMNRQEKLRDHPFRWTRKDHACVPGNVSDQRPHHFNNSRRFDKWHKLPVAAWKLYWRFHDKNR